MREAYPSIGGLDAEVIAVSSDAVEVTRADAALAALPFPVLSDARLEAIDRYGVQHENEPNGRRIARPAVFVVDRRGTVGFAHVGEHPRDRPTVEALLLALETIE